MSEELTQEEIIEKAKQEAAEKAKAEAQAEAKKAQDAMTAELQAERQRRQAAEEEIERGKGKQEVTEDDPEKVYERLRKKEKDEESKKNRELAIEEFKRNTRELSPDNDPGGLVYSAFERELRKFNLEGLSTKEEYVARLKEVHEFMNRNKKQSDTPHIPYEGADVGGGSSPKETDPANLTDKEVRLIKDMGWTKERYIEAKSKRPYYVESLLKYRS